MTTLTGKFEVVAWDINCFNLSFMFRQSILRKTRLFTDNQPAQINSSLDAKNPTFMIHETPQRLCVLLVRHSDCLFIFTKRYEANGCSAKAVSCQVSPSISCVTSLCMPQRQRDTCAVCCLGGERRALSKLNAQTLLHLFFWTRLKEDL